MVVLITGGGWGNFHIGSINVTKSTGHPLKYGLLSYTSLNAIVGVGWRWSVLRLEEYDESNATER